MSFYSIRKKELTDIADAIRAKTGKSDGMTVEDMPKEIGEISGGKNATCKTSVDITQPTKMVSNMTLIGTTGVTAPSGLKYYYNHELLPEIPANVVENYPYILIMRTPSTTRIYASTAKAYFWTTEEGVNRITIPTGNYIRYTFNSEANTWILDSSGTGTYFTVHGSGSWAVWWSNYEMPNGSADAEEIYWGASEPMTEQPAKASRFYYSNELLPKIPEDLLIEYPYAWIRKNTTSGYFDLLLSDTPFYHNSSAIEEGKSIAGQPWYRVAIAAAETATEWTDNTGTHSYSGWTLDSARTILWSNHDIPDGSATATNVYFYGTLAVPQ